MPTNRCRAITSAIAAPPFAIAAARTIRKCAVHHPCWLERWLVCNQRRDLGYAARGLL